MEHKSVLSNFNKSHAIYYSPRGETNFQTWYTECKESFSKAFVIITGHSYNRKLTIRCVTKQAKINSLYYQSEVPTPIYHTEIPALYGTDTMFGCIRISHTSGVTLRFLERMVQETEIYAIPFSNIPVKSPDASPMDFCAFVLWKGHWKKTSSYNRCPVGICEEWRQMDKAIQRKSLLQWKLRCRAIVNMKGHHDKCWRYSFS